MKELKRALEQVNVIAYSKFFVILMIFFPASSSFGWVISRNVNPVALVKYSDELVRIGRLERVSTAKNGCEGYFGGVVRKSYKGSLIVGEKIWIFTPRDGFKEDTDYFVVLRSGPQSLSVAECVGLQQGGGAVKSFYIGDKQVLSYEIVPSEGKNLERSPERFIVRECGNVTDAIFRVMNEKEVFTYEPVENVGSVRCQVKSAPYPFLEDTLYHLIENARKFDQKKKGAERISPTSTDIPTKKGSELFSN